MTKHAAILSIPILSAILNVSFGEKFATRLAAQASHVIEPAEVVNALVKKRNQVPGISTERLVAYGNALITNRGYDFSFNACEIAKANKADESFGDELRPFRYKLRDLTGKNITFQIMNRYFEQPCGCGFDIPVFQVTDKEITVRADGKPTKLIRPKEFALDEVELVDRSLKKSLRKWYMPSDDIPFGISRDGKKIYIGAGYDDFSIENIALEVAENGVVKYVPRNSADIIGNGKELTKNAKDFANGVGYMRFTPGNLNYFVKFSYPCT